MPALSWGGDGGHMYQVCVCVWGGGELIRQAWE